MRVFTAGSLLQEYCLLSVRFSLISSIVSSEVGLLSNRTLLDFGMALSTAVLITATIKSAYLSRSLVGVSPVQSAQPSAASSVDSNTSLSVWSNLYLVWLIEQLKLRWVGDRCPSRHIFEIGCHVLLGLVI